ncbi:autotransporter outer membrane beta-barrel domain-containing protein [Tistrella mobilis]|uniref:autotransporter domain-containing protein n=1 Tax=Tistrella mobilis TaxID=171437 RepID=UPI003556308F
MAGHPRSLDREVDLSRRLIHLRRHLMAGAAMTVMVWGVGSRDEVLADTIQVGSGDVPLRLEALSDLPTTVEIVAGSTRTVTDDEPAVSSETPGWTLENRGEVTAGGVGVGLVGSTLVNDTDARITGAAGVQMADPDGTAGLAVENAGVITGQAGAGLVAAGSGVFALDNRASGAIFAEGPALLVQAAQAVIGNEGTIQSNQTDGALINAGEVIVANGTNGVIIGEAVGLGVTGGTVDVTNDGVVSGGYRSPLDVSGGIAVQSAEARVVNGATGTALGRSAGITVQAAGTATVENAGTTNGVILDGGAAAVLRNAEGGTITAQTVNLVTGTGTVTVENDGVISDAAGYGIEIGSPERFPAAINLQNGTTGEIRGSIGGVQAMGGAIDIDNAGKILSDRGTGIIAAAMGGVGIVNRTGGMVLSGDVALTAAGSEVMLDNAGTLQSYDADGVRIDAGTVSVMNRSDAVILGDGIGLAIRGDTVDVTNAGTIAGGANSGLPVSGGIAIQADTAMVVNQAGGMVLGREAGVTVEAGNSAGLINAGVSNGVMIDGGTQAVLRNLAGGSITAETDNLVTGRGTVLVENAGIIEGSAAGKGSEIGLIAGTRAGAARPAETILINEAGGRITGFNGAAVLSGDVIRIENRGTIDGILAPAVSATADVTHVVNEGLVAGGTGFLIDGDATLTNAAGAEILTWGTAVFTTGAADVVNAGQIVTVHGVVPDDVPDGAVAVGSGSHINNLAGGVILNRRWAGIAVSDGTGDEDPAARETVIENAGLIRSEGPGHGVGVAVAGRVTISNLQGGIISAAGLEGVTLRAGTAIIDNAGTIIGGGSDGDAQIIAGLAVIGDETVVTNRAGGVIAGDRMGVALNAGNGAVLDNAGFINGIYLEGGASAELKNTAAGVVAADEGNGLISDVVVVDNAGVITGGTSALTLLGGTGSVINTGTIDGGGGVGIASGVTGGTSVVNSGTITGRAVGIGTEGTLALDNAGRVSGGNVAVYGADGTIVNRDGGVITGASGVVLVGGGGARPSVDNAGTIDAMAGNAVAAANGSVRNSGSITSLGDAVVLTGGALDNLAGGSVVAGGVAVYLVADEDGHAGSISNAGTVTGGAAGVLIQDGRGSVVNTGSIEGADGGSGIVGSQASATSVVNSGTVSGSVFGIVTLGSLTLDNTGRIRSDEAAVHAMDGAIIENRAGGEIVAEGTAIQLTGEALITNAGLIRSAQGIAITVEGDAVVGNAEGGVIEAAGPALLLAGTASLTNAGRISSTDPTFGGDDAEGVAILAGSGGLIANTGVIESGAGAVMIGDVADDAGELTTAIANDGLIQARGDGVALAADIIGGLEIANTNTIVAADGLAIDVAAAEVLLGNSGVIVSDGASGILLHGDDIAVSNGEGALIRGGGGTALIVAGESVDIANGGVIVGAEAGLAVDGGEVAVTNDINGVIDGEGYGAVIQSAGDATFDNAGYVAGLSVVADGAVSLNNSGTGVIAGTAGNAFAGTDVTLENAGVISGTDGGLVVTGDTVEIANGGSIIGLFGAGLVVSASDEVTVTNTGTISGGGIGIGIDGNAFIDNAGTISGDEVALAFGSGAIRNAGGGVISGGIGIVATGEDGSAELINEGLIQATGGLAVALGGGAILNHGTITAMATGDPDGETVPLAIELAGGSLVNAAGGVVSSAGTTILDLGDVDGNAGAIRNEGQILGDIAIVAGGDGFVLDNIGGRIAGQSFAVSASGADIRIRNEAGLIAGGMVLSGSDAVIDNRSGGVVIRTGQSDEDGNPNSAVIDLVNADGAVITNAGLIAGTNAYGIRAGVDDETEASSLDVVNLSGARIAGVTAIDAEVDTLDIDNAGFLTGENYGVYATADDVSIVNRAGGEITGGISAIDVEGGFDIENAGAISGGNDERHAPAMFLIGDGMLANAAGGRITGGVAISSDADGLVDVVNAGVIEAERLAIQAGGEASVENQAGGLISAALGIVFTNSIDPDSLSIDTPTLVNRGEIRGGVIYDAGMVNIADIGGRLGANEDGWALTFSEDADERWLTVRDGAVIDGDVLAGEINDLDAARDREDSVATFEGGGSFAHDLGGFGLIEKEGAGTWRFSGNLLAAAFDVNEGGVRLDGRFTGDEMTVGAAGTLSGNGTIDGDLISEGQVAPGNSIGTITVTGDFTQTATGTLAMEYAADGAGGTVTDRLVVGGAAMIEGGTLSLSSFDGSTPRYASTELITAADGITGTFDTVETDRAGLVGRLLADGDVISLRLVDTENGFRALATTRNARNVATVLETQGLTATGDRDQLLTELAALDDADAAAALGDLAGSEYAGHWRYLRGTGRAFVDGAANAAHAGHRGAWITGFGNTGRTSGEDAAGDLRWRSAGTAVGIDFAVGEAARLGIAAGVTDGRTTARSRDAGIDTTGWHVGAYGAVPAGPVTLDAVVAYTRSSSDADRSITGTDRTARGSFDTDQVTAAIGVSTDLVVPGAKPGTPEAAAGAPSWTVTPMLRLIYDRQKSDDVTETGAGAAALVVQGGTVEGLEAFAGVRFSTAYGDASKGETVIRPSFTLGVGQELLDRDQTLTAHFTGDPANTFQVEGISQGRTTGRIGAAVEADVAPGVTLGVGYAGAIDETGGDHRLTAGLRFSW